jgi:hypothetical protein
MRRPFAAVAVLILAQCRKSTAVDPRYPARPDGCAVHSFAADPTIPVDDLGDIEVACEGSSKCGRKLADAVCERGGDVVWGIAENPAASPTMRAHTAHTRVADHPSLPAGCEVRVFANAPPMPLDNIGTVSATCAEGDSDDVCTRQLQDEVCKLGGDVAWGVDRPAHVGNKRKMSGRAAHTK